MTPFALPRLVPGRPGVRPAAAFTLALAALLAALGGCTPPGSLVPSAATVSARLTTVDELARQPRQPTRVQPGDTLRIVRDAQDSVLDIRSLVDDSQTSLYVVRPDGSFSFRYAGRVEAAGKTPDEIAALLRERLTPIYREPAVTVNIMASPASKVIVGGAVRNPGVIDLNAAPSFEQALFAAGGLLPAAEPSVVALLRLDAQERYQVHILDMSGLLNPPPGGRAALALQRGDLIFVPRSAAGRSGEGVEVYLNQLLPFARSFGVSVNRTID